MNGTNQITAKILVKCSKSDRTYQEILVREGEYYHPQLFKWLLLPEGWRNKAARALSEAEAK